MSQRLVRLVHMVKQVEWQPVPGLVVAWRLGAWVEVEYRDQAEDFLEAFIAVRSNFDPSPQATLSNLWAALKKFTPTLRAVSLHDGVREYQASVEDA